MAESTKVRLVRCPKCENLLPELADYSVYQCGGCGAVLRAKSKNRDGDNLSERSDEGVVSGIPAQEKLSQEQGMVNFSDTSDVDVKSNADSLRSEEKKPEKDDNAIVDRASDQSKAKSGKLVVEDAAKANVDGRDSVNAVGKESGDSIAQNGNTSESGKSGGISSLQRQERGEVEGFRRITRTGVQGVRFSASNYQDEGPSNYNLNPTYGYGEVLQSYDGRDGDGRGRYVENDQAELLRKLDELKEQLGRSAKVTGERKEKLPLDGKPRPPNPHHDTDPWFPSGSVASNGAPVQFFVPDNHASGISYFNHHPEPFPYSHGHQMASHGFHPPTQKSSHITGYGDPLGPQMPRRDPHQVPGRYQQPIRRYFSGRYFDASPDPFEPFPTNANFHHPTCSCFHCYNKHHGVPAPVPPTNFSNKRFPDISSSPIMYHQDIPRAFGSNVHNSRTSVPPPLNNWGPQSHTRWPSDINSELGGFVRFHPRKVVLACGSRRCHPIAGGAPFLTCCNCFELLRIPKKAHLLAKRQQKVQCGACSTVINFSFVDKRLILSVNTEAGQASDMADDGSRLMMIDKNSYSYGKVRRTNATFSSDDYENSGYDFQAIDPDPIEPSTCQGLNSAKPQEMQSFTSSSPSLSEDDHSPDNLTAPGEGTNSAEQPVKATLSPPLPGSPLQQYFDYSNYNRAVSRFGKGNRSSRSDQEKAMTNKATARQNSMKDASLATEVEVSFHEYSSTGVSQEAGVASKEENPSKNRKGGESFFANFIKKNFKDISKSNQMDERTRNYVSVNGHVIPDRLVKKAEKLSGPIHPGQYWYDSKAGFWGVMGGPCLGMIPPSIEEFDHPMPENCSGGDTGIFVNGRELHQKDLDLLASRGLPTETDRSYIIEMSGRVVDEDTGEELESLGKLAPTVEKVKHGFGMKVPKVAA